MECRQRRTRQVNTQHEWGVSVSLKQCRAFNIDPIKCIEYLAHDIGLRRFRLMSYWDEHEKTPGEYDLAELDAQIEAVRKTGGEVSLCLGVRQPRWPESHWPEWSLKLDKKARYEALEQYLEAVVNRYKNEACITGYQLENECLNRSFGRHGDFNRKRLRAEFSLLKKLDPTRPIIMSTSNSWGLPLRKPRPDQFGFSYYSIEYKNGKYNRSKLPSWWWKFRARLVRFITRRPVFIHELQAEPWGPKAIWEMSQLEQHESMNAEILQSNIKSVKKTGLYPIDLWGGEWWYWSKVKQNDPSLGATVRDIIKE